jgi:Ca2+-binding EF-hand superfamily protein
MSSISGAGFAGGMPSASMMSQMRDKMFGKADANSDGSVDKAEFAKGGPQGAQGAGKKSDEMFAKIDTDANGKLSQDEFKSFEKTMSTEMQSMMLAMQGGGGGAASGADPMQSLIDMLSKNEKTGEVSGTSRAEQGKRLDELFAKADGDKDGKLSKDEMKGFAETQASQFKSSLLSAQEQSQKSSGTDPSAIFNQLFGSNSSASGSGSNNSTDPFVRMMMQQLSAV